MCNQARYAMFRDDEEKESQAEVCLPVCCHGQGQECIFSFLGYCSRCTVCMCEQFQKQWENLQYYASVVRKHSSQDKQPGALSELLSNLSTTLVGKWLHLETLIVLQLPYLFRVTKLKLCSSFV